MEFFDILLVVLGVLLIAAGLFLFISGTQESEKQNEVQGFGLKINVSNPSIILIVLGIGLVLVPKFVTKDATSSSEPMTPQPTPAPSVTPQVPQIVEPTIVEPSTPTPAIPQPTPTTINPVPAPEVPSAPAPKPKAVWYPKGTWNMIDYEEGGIDASENVSGNIIFAPNQKGGVDWVLNMVISDWMGNQVAGDYSGQIESRNTGYIIHVTNSNTPNFKPEYNRPLKMYMEGEKLHFELVFDSQKLITHFVQ